MHSHFSSVALGLNSYSSGTRVQAQESWHGGLDALRHVGISPDQELSPCFLPWLEDHLPLSHQGHPEDFLS